MTPAESITARRWFICPSWAAVVPLLVDGIERPGQHDERADAARAELLRLAQGLDDWNERAPRLRELLARVLDCIEDGEPRLATTHALRALRLLEGKPEEAAP